MKDNSIGHDVCIQGISAELKVIEFLLRNQVVALNPVGNYAAYDIVSEVNGRYHKIQVKSHLVVDGKTPSISLRTPINSKDFDIIAVVLYNEPKDFIYLIPSSLLEGKSYISFSPKKRMKWDMYLNSASALLR